MLHHQFKDGELNLKMLVFASPETLKEIVVSSLCLMAIEEDNVPTL
jgi:hypothetical protein